MNQVKLKPAEDVEWTGALGSNIHGFLIKPNNFDASKKYPVYFFVYGEPASATAKDLPSFDRENQKKVQGFVS